MVPDDSTLPILQRAIKHGTRPALVDTQGKYTYDKLLQAGTNIAATLLGDEADLKEQRVAFMVPHCFDYVAALWGIWMAGGIAVPLALSHPPPEIQYTLENSAARIIVAHPEFIDMLRPIADAKNIRLISTECIDSIHHQHLPKVNPHRRAMILYTSGTTHKPKGVVLSHQNITAQITTLIDAWEWTSEDTILNVLPLHHTHGIINVLCCALWAGALCEMMPKFDASRVWERLAKGDFNLFMAVPTIYVQLIQAFNEASLDQQQRLSAACGKLRLMVSGSAALSTSVFEEFKRISGHELLERYGMTETGMVLSNPLHGERRPGFVGMPLPGLKVRLVSQSGREVATERTAAELQVKGPGVFTEYWKNADATSQAFKNGWFCTGDIAMIDNGYYRILGRSSVDIIKSGGYKISALEIEAVLAAHPAIAECAVVGVPDEEWGERIGVVVILHKNSCLSIEELRRWTRERMAPYKMPSVLVTTDELPRNAMGKVTKTDLKHLFDAGRR